MVKSERHSGTHETKVVKSKDILNSGIRHTEKTLGRLKIQKVPQVVCIFATRMSLYSRENDESKPWYALVLTMVNNLSLQPGWVLMSLISVEWVLNHHQTLAINTATGTIPSTPASAWFADRLLFLAKLLVSKSCLEVFLQTSFLKTCTMLINKWWTRLCHSILKQFWSWWKSPPVKVHLRPTPTPKLCKSQDFPTTKKTNSFCAGSSTIPDSSISCLACRYKSCQPSILQASKCPHNSMLAIFRSFKITAILLHFPSKRVH